MLLLNGVSNPEINKDGLLTAYVVELNELWPPNIQ
jgi:hypothetical protein